MNIDKHTELVAAKPAPLSAVLKDGAGEIRQTLGHMAHDSRDAVGQMVEDGKHRVDEFVDEGRTRAREWKDSFGKTVGERPIQSLLIATGVGALLGMLLRRRNA